MTWWTEEGDVTMPEPVIALLVERAMELRDMISEGIEFDNPAFHPKLGVRVFDSLEPKTQIFALAYVLRHLSDPDLPSPELVAWHEGTVWAMFLKIGHELIVEFDLAEEPETDKDLKLRFRSLTRKALEAVDPSARCPSIRSRELDDWTECLDAISEHIFWDHDFLEADFFDDLDPHHARNTREVAGIDDDYFSTPPPLVREEDYREADRYLRQLAGYPKLPDPWGVNEA